MGPFVHERFFAVVSKMGEAGYPLQHTAHDTDIFASYDEAKFAGLALAEQHRKPNETWLMDIHKQYVITEDL